MEDVAHCGRDTVKHCLERSGDTVDNARQSRRETVHDARDGCTHALEYCLRAICGHLPVACEDANKHADNRLNYADRGLNDAGDCSHNRHDDAADNLKRRTKYHGHDCGHCSKRHAQVLQDRVNKWLSRCSELRNGVSCCFNVWR